MKIAVLLRGISYIENYKSKRATLNTDYRTYIESFRDFWEGHEIDVFFHTYEHDYIDQMLEDYLPKAHMVTKFNPDMHPYQSCNQSVKNVIAVFKNYCDQNKEKYDIAVCTRFDIWYTSTFKMFRIDKPVNLFMDNFSEDNFYILKPDDMFEHLTRCLNKWPRRSHHQIIMRLRPMMRSAYRKKGDEKSCFHILFTEKVGGGRCPYYRIRSLPPNHPLNKR